MKALDYYYILLISSFTTDSIVEAQTCVDSITFTFGEFTYQDKLVTRTCEWLTSGNTEAANANRRGKWCGGRIYNGVVVNEQCPRACLLCSEPSQSPSPSFSMIPTLQLSIEPSIEISTDIPSRLPSSGEPTTISLNPSIIPTREITINPTSAPSQQPTITMQPTPLKSEEPSSQPSEVLSSNPSTYPSQSPSNHPSVSPSISPSFSLQSFEIYISMDFDEIQEFGGEAKDIFQHTTDEFIKTILDEKHEGVDFIITTSIVGFEMIVPNGIDSGDTGYRIRRSLNQFKSIMRRKIQSSESTLRIFIIANIHVRSGTLFTSDTLISDIIKALDEQSERETFILALQLADTTNTFSPINAMSKFKINNEEIVMIVKKDNTNAWTYIGVGAGIGVSVLAFIVIGFTVIRRRRNDIHTFEYFDNRSYKQIDPRISSTIELDHDGGEVSTLGDPGGQTVYSIPNLSVVMRQSQPKLLGIHAYERMLFSDMNMNLGETQSVSTGSQSVSNAEGDFHPIVVVAPPGCLGVVIGTKTGYPAVHAIKDTSTIIDQVQIGDRLISVDGVDTRKMPAIRVSNLIGSKASNPERVLVFARYYSRYT